MRYLNLARSLAVIALIAAALPCLAGEVAVLKNGFSIRHERHETIGSVTRLYTSVDGSSFVDIQTADLDHFEATADLPVSETPVANSRMAIPAHAMQPVSALTAPTPALRAVPKADITTVVKDASGRYQLDPDLVNSVIKAESGFNVRAVSPKGARGLMQLMPGTASQLGVPNAFDAQANVDGGTKYLRELLERYNFDLVKALAAYNAGPQRVERFGGVPPYYETRAYVARIVKDFNKKKIAQGKAAPTRINVAQTPRTKPANTSTARNHPTKQVTEAKAGTTQSE